MNKYLFLLLLIISINSFGQNNGYYKNLDSAIANPTKVITLDLERQKLKEVPKEILLFKNLERLILKRNYINEVPKEISLLTRLHYLDLSSNYIETLPKELSSIKLDTLIMWDNKIRVFPQEFETFGKELLYLDLRAIQMNKEEQKAIKQLFPNAKKKLSHPCNCNR